jgi:hypothetical protein
MQQKFLRAEELAMLLGATAQRLQLEPDGHRPSQPESAGAFATAAGPLRSRWPRTPSLLIQD